MNIPRSVMEPFGYTGMPTLSMYPPVVRIEQALRELFFSIVHHDPSLLALRLEMEAISAGASNANCIIDHMKHGYWARLEFQIDGSPYWHKQTYLHTRT